MSDKKNEKKKEEEMKEKKCHCDDENCACDDECKCDDENCDCGCHDGEKKLSDLEIAVGQANEFLNLARNIQADFDNYRKRIMEELKTVKFDGMATAVIKFLPMLDSTVKARKMIKDDSTVEGLDMVIRDFENALNSLGVEKIETKNNAFDPNVANVIATQTDNSLEDGIVIEEIQAGYKINNKVIRYAQVVVNKK